MAQIGPAHLYPAQEYSNLEQGRPIQRGLPKNGRSKTPMTASHTHGIATLEARARRATITAWIFIAAQIGTMLLIGGSYAGLVTPSGAYDIAGTLTFSTLLLSMILIGMWIHRAHANLFDLGFEGVSYSPGWSVGWFFVPFLNLFKPFDAMKELWNSSTNADNRFDSPAPPLLKTWWAGWLIGNVGSNYGQTLLEANSPQSLALAQGLIAVSALALAGAAYCMIQIMREVTAAQVRGISIGNVFA